MIYTVDRVQFNENGGLIFFEFFNYLKDSRDFAIKKYQSIKNINNINIITVKYGDYVNKSKIIVKYNNEKYTFTWKEYIDWFVNINNTGRGNGAIASKHLGSATKNEGDPFIHEILKEIHKVELSKDDNGLGITKEALDGKSTYGFDFDLFDDIDNTIIEFLNNETKSKTKLKNEIDNIKAHPMRYAWISQKEQDDYKKRMKEEYPDWENPRKKDNRQKYISLWKSKQILGGDLYLVNYNKLNLTEDLSIIKIIDLDVEKGITEDISYKVTYNELIKWLTLMNEDPVLAKKELNKYPKEIRDKSFWDKYYENQAKYITPSRSKIGTKYK